MGAAICFRRQIPENGSDRVAVTTECIYKNQRLSLRPKSLAYTKNYVVLGLLEVGKKVTFSPGTGHNQLMLSHKDCEHPLEPEDRNHTTR